MTRIVWLLGCVACADGAVSIDEQTWEAVQSGTARLRCEAADFDGGSRLLSVDVPDGSVAMVLKCDALGACSGADYRFDDGTISVVCGAPADEFRVRWLEPIEMRWSRQN